jgi:hypothetical protein
LLREDKAMKLVNLTCPNCTGILRNDTDS